MILFWIICAALLLLALPFVAVPLWRKSAANNDVLRDAANLEILRDQSSEMAADLDYGLLTQDAFEQGQRELQSRLLEEVQPAQTPVAAAHNPAKILAVVLMVLIPVGSVLLYLQLGSSRALLPQQAEMASAEGFGIIRSESGLQELERKLANSPMDPDGWLQLARSYSEMTRYADAKRAYEQLVKLVPDEAQLWTDYADVYAMSNGQSLLGEPAKLLDRALSLDANNTTALALAGSAAMERGDYVAAITHWQKLISLLPADYPDIQMISHGIMQARENLALEKGGKEKLAKLPADKAPAKVAVSREAITGKVTLSPALASKADSSDTVFILARAASGPKMPLAVLRKQVRDLPFEFSLDDSMAMQPQLKLSGFDSVVVVARISKSGTPMAQPGDIEGVTSEVKPGTKGLKIVIDSVVR